MNFRDVLVAVGAAAMLLPLLAALAFGGVVLSIANADHRAIASALGAAPARDLGAGEMEQTRRGFREGFFPDCAALSQLLREPSAPTPAAAAVRSETILPLSERTICEELQTVLRGEGADVAWFTYARYWHGFLVLHRAVLSGDSYAALQGIGAALVAGALAVLFGALAWRVGAMPALAATAAFALLSDAVAIGALPVQAVSVTALCLCAAGFAVFGAGRSRAGALIAAIMAGAVYNFFDFLCNPDCLAMLCAWLWVAHGVRRGERRTLLGAVLVFGAVLGGYGAFWAAKWAIAGGYAVSGGKVYLFGFGDVERWGPGGGAIPGQALIALVMATFDAWWKLVLGAALAGIVALLARPKRRAHDRLHPSGEGARRAEGGRDRGADDLRTMSDGHSAATESRALPGAPPLPSLRDTFPRTAIAKRDRWGKGIGAMKLLLPIVLGLLTVELLAGHTIAHTSITFRIVPLALGLIGASAILLSQMAPPARKAAISAAV